MKIFFALGIGIAVVLVSVAGLYVYSTTESTTDSDNVQPISITEKVEPVVVSDEPDVHSIKVDDNMGIVPEPLP